MHGFLIVDKPAGWTSHDVVARLRRILGERQIGHAGTLDPAATGVLPLAVGDATRVLEFLAGAGKTYLAEFTFGVTTDTDDADGRVLDVRPLPPFDAAELEAALARFRGEIEQVPPSYAAIRVGGRHLYELARQGVEVERAPRRVMIHHLELLAWQPPVATLCVDCSKGTYIRALARDLGAAIGTGAYLSNLVRLRTGPFTLCDALTIDQIARAELPGEWPDLAVHPDILLEDWPALILDDEQIRRWQRGQRIPGGEVGVATDDWCRVYDVAGDWHGIGRWTPGVAAWQPVKVVGVR